MSAPATRSVQITELVGPVTLCFMQILKVAGELTTGGVLIVQGGTYAGKTVALLQYIAYRMAVAPGMTVTVAGKSIPHLRRGAYQDFQNLRNASPLLMRLFPASGWNKSERRFTATNGATIVFDSFPDPHKARGIKSDILFVNEADGMPVEVYDQLKMRTNLLTLIDYNPSAPFWAHDIKDNPNHAFIRVNYAHNQFVSPEKIAEIEGWRHTNSEKYLVYGEGKTGKTEGLVFSFARAPIPDTAKLVGYGLDFGYSVDPSACISVWQFDGALYLKEEIYQRGLLTSDLAALMKPLNRTVPMIGDSARPDMIAELQSYGFPIRPAKKGPDSIKFGIEVMKEYRLYVTPDSPYLADEMRRYSWAKDVNDRPTGKPVDAFNHGIDAARYLCTAMLAKSNIGNTKAHVYKVPSNNPNL